MILEKRLRYSDAFGVAAVCGLSVNLSAINKFGNRMPLVSLEHHSFDSLTEASVIEIPQKYSLQGTTQGNGLTGGVPPVRFSM